MVFANIIRLASHFKDYKWLSWKILDQLINPFPFKNVIIMKDMLSVVLTSNRIKAACTSLDFIINNLKRSLSNPNNTRMVVLMTRTLNLRNLLI